MLLCRTMSRIEKGTSVMIDPLAGSNESKDEAEDTVEDEISKLLTKSRTNKMVVVKAGSK